MASDSGVQRERRFAVSAYKECPACHTPITVGTPIKRYFQRVGGFGPEGRWEDTKKFKHASCPKRAAPRKDSRGFVRQSQLLDAEDYR